MINKVKNVLWTMLCMMFVAVLFTVSAFATRLPFTDVQSNRWSYEYIKTLYDAGIINGASATKFAPSANITRAEFVKILGGIEGINAKKYKGSDFDDVSANAWYAPYVKWAVKAGVTKGVSVTSFDPNGQITRQDMATMIYRYVEFCDIDLKKVNKSIEFSDLKKIASYALTGVMEMQRAGIINGIKNQDGTYRFAPNNNATREEASKMLCLIYDIIESTKADADVKPAPTPTPTPDLPQKPQITRAEAFDVIKCWIIDNANYQFDDGDLAYSKDLNEESEYLISYDAEYNEISMIIYEYMGYDTYFESEKSFMCVVTINPNDYNAYIWFNNQTFDGLILLKKYGYLDARTFDKDVPIDFTGCEGYYSDSEGVVEAAEELCATTIAYSVALTDSLILNEMDTLNFDMSIFGWNV